MAIIAAQKDALLRHLVEDCPLDTWGSQKRNEPLCDLLNNDLAAVLGQFERMGLISFTPTYDSFNFKIHVEAHDFYGRGGFFVNEDLFQKSIVKLIAELDALEKLDAGTADRALRLRNIKDNLIQGLGVLANVATFGEAFKKLL